MSFGIALEISARLVAHAESKSTKVLLQFELRLYGLRIPLAIKVEASSEDHHLNPAALLNSSEKH